MPLLFVQLSTILGVAVVMSMITRALRQPLIIGYLLTGLIVGPAVLGLVHTDDPIAFFGQIGVALLLFIVGLGLRPEALREVGKVAVVAGLGQIIFTATIGYGIAALLGYGWVAALYISVAFTFSSTIVVLQLLYTKEEQDTLYGRISTGFLLVQDLVAMLIFLFLTSTDTSYPAGLAVAYVVAKVVAVLAAIYLLMTLIVPRVEQWFSQSREVLFLFAIGTCFGLTMIFEQLHFSPELGALVAGVLLSTSPHHREIAARMYSLRDFFLILFFVVLGTHISADSIAGSWPLIMGFSAFILIGNPLIVVAILRRMKYTLRTSFYGGLTVAQISEFSLIMLTMGAAIGHIDTALLGPATLVGLITILVSSYFIMHNRRLYELLEPFLRRVFGDVATETSTAAPAPVDVVLFGSHRLGSGLVRMLAQAKTPFLVVDHDPAVIRRLQAAEIPVVFGSADDASILESLPLNSAKAIITTIPDPNVNATIVEYVRSRNSEATILCVANHQSQAAALYKAGATYVIVPPYLGRRYLTTLLQEYGFSAQGYAREREHHLRELQIMERSFIDENVVL